MPFFRSSPDVWGTPTANVADAILMQVILGPTHVISASMRPLQPWQMLSPACCSRKWPWQDTVIRRNSITKIILEMGIGVFDGKYEGKQLWLLGGLRFYFFHSWAGVLFALSQTILALLALASFVLGEGQKRLNRSCFTLWYDVLPFFKWTSSTAMFS